jgi:hypothetical protein
MTPAELLETVRAAFQAGTSTVTAGHGAPAEVTATPAVVLRPADPFVVPNRRAGPVAEVRWTVQVLEGRYDLEASLASLTAGYLSAVKALHAARAGQVGPLGQIEPTSIADVPVIAGTFLVTLDHHPGGP